jgi:N-methylhydantoinase B
MTNTLNTPVEALEYAYPLRVLRYEIRRGMNRILRFSTGYILISSATPITTGATWCSTG